MSERDGRYWERCLSAFLAEAVDQALDGSGAADRARRYRAAALGLADGQDAPVCGTNEVASWLDPLPLPSIDATANPPLRRVHPISGVEIPLGGPGVPGGASPLMAESNSPVVPTSKPCGSGLAGLGGVDADAVRERTAAIRDICRPYYEHQERQRAYALWRLLPEVLRETRLLPSDPWVSDHAVIDRLDAFVALASCEGPVAFLCFAVRPRQDLALRCRSVEELWTAEHTRSWLVLHGLSPVLRCCGPWAVDRPCLRGNALVDWWLRREGCRNTPEPDPRSLRRAALDPVYTAVVPWERREDLRGAVLSAVREAWDRLCGRAHGELAACWGQDWDTSWAEQCASFWTPVCTILPSILGPGRDDVARQAERLRWRFQELLGELPSPVRDAATIAETVLAVGKDGPASGGDNTSARASSSPATPTTQPGNSGLAGLWMLERQLLDKVCEAQDRMFSPPQAASDDHRPACFRFPGYAAMGPRDPAACRAWWREQGGAPDQCGLAPDRPLCAPALTLALLQRIPFDDELPLAAAPAASASQALLMAAWDDGRPWQGEARLSFRQVLHPRAIEGLLGLSGNLEPVLDRRCPPSPAAERAVIRGLTEFSQALPALIEETVPGSLVIHCGLDRMLVALPGAGILTAAAVLARLHREHLPGLPLDAGVAIARGPRPIAALRAAVVEATAKARRSGGGLCMSVLDGPDAECLVPWYFGSECLPATWSTCGADPRLGDGAAVARLLRDEAPLLALPAQALAARIACLLSPNADADGADGLTRLWTSFRSAALALRSREHPFWDERQAAVQFLRCLRLVAWIARQHRGTREPRP